MHSENKTVVLISMPFAGVNIPSIQLQLLESYLKQRDVKVTTKHLYLKYADTLGLKIYNSIIFPPNDSYKAQIIFSKYLFPENWHKKTDEIKNYFENKILSLFNEKIKFSFQEYVDKTDEFFIWCIKNIDWQNYDIVGFTLNYGQFLPSLAFAKKIKELNPEKKIVFGGSRTFEELGKKVLESFDFIDFIISGDGEESLYQLTNQNYKINNIPGLIYRQNKNTIFNNRDNSIDINKLPIINYDQYFIDLAVLSDEMQQHFQYYGKIPIEISRGCWWNRCSFCNMNIQNKKYREKNIDKIIEEIRILSDKYEILDFQIISNTLPLKHFKELFYKLEKIGKDFNFIAESRAGNLKSEDYTLLKNAGFSTIQTGIESLSSSYLKKMNKGTRVIDNIAALKYCKENRIRNAYNLIINYPNEENIDFKQSIDNINLIKQYIDPPNICNLKVVYGSPIFYNYKNFNIKKLINSKIDKIMFPENYLDKGFNFVYDYEILNKRKENNWNYIIDDWKKEREKFIDEAIKKQTDVDLYILYYVDGGKFIKIYDKRSFDRIDVYVLNENERNIFLNCIDVVSFEEIKNKLYELIDYEIRSILDSFVKAKLVFREDDYYLSLPLNYSKLAGIRKNKNINNNILQVLTAN